MTKTRSRNRLVVTYGENLTPHSSMRTFLDASSLAERGAAVKEMERSLHPAILRHAGDACLSLALKSDQPPLERVQWLHRATDNWKRTINAQAFTERAPTAAMGMAAVQLAHLPLYRRQVLDGGSPTGQELAMVYHDMLRAGHDLTKAYAREEKRRRRNPDKPHPEMPRLTGAAALTSALLLLHRHETLDVFNTSHRLIQPAQLDERGIGGERPSVPTGWDISILEAGAEGSYSLNHALVVEGQQPRPGILPVIDNVPVTQLVVTRDLVIDGEEFWPTKVIKECVREMDNTGSNANTLRLELRSLMLQNLMDRASAT